MKVENTRIIRFQICHHSLGNIFHMEQGAKLFAAEHAQFSLREGFDRQRVHNQIHPDARIQIADTEERSKPEYDGVFILQKGFRF